jgi:thioredoxin reductase (NADPH)
MNDLIIVGGGPAGLSAAIYAAREGLKTSVLCADLPGGMLPEIHNLENYPGFPDGINGGELADRFARQAERFGANVVKFTTVEKLGADDENWVVKTDDGDFRARAVLLACGSAHKKLGVTGEKEFAGRGVHYCATCDGPNYKGKKLAVVGGANSAFSEALFLADFASHVTILVRSHIKAEDVLVERARKNPKISIIEGAPVEKIVGADGKMTGLELGGGHGTLAVDGVFVAIGLEPGTGWLKGSDVELDEKNMVRLKDGHTTTAPGIFAAGDARAKAVHQIITAAADGVVAAREVRDYLR